MDLTFAADVPLAPFTALRRSLLGTISGGRLTLQVPQADGTIRQITMTSAGVAGYNKTVAALRGRVREADSTLMCGGNVVVNNGACAPQGSMTAEPSRLVLAADGGAFLTDLRWSGWGDPAATATALLRHRSCTPTCMEGTWSGTAVTVTVTSLIRAGSIRYYSAMHVTSPAAGINDHYQLVGP